MRKIARINPASVDTKGLYQLLRKRSDLRRLNL